jgi:hypothetical protein
MSLLSLSKKSLKYEASFDKLKQIFLLLSILLPNAGKAAVARLFKKSNQLYNPKNHSLFNIFLRA